MKDWLKKLAGIKRLAEEKERLVVETALAAANAEAAKKEEELAKMSSKERANALGEPYVGVINTHINKDNIRNGFFELDWNDQFIVQLKQAGYGFDGDSEEQIVDRWFRELCRDVASEEGIDMTDRGAGYINVQKLTNGKSEIS